MKIDTLEKLYDDQMSSHRHGLEQFLEFLPRIMTVTSHSQLRDSIRELIPQLRAQITRLERILPKDLVAEQANDSPAIRGIINEGHAFLERASDACIIDAGLVSLLRRILHFLMAGYASLSAFSALLGHDEEARLLKRCLNEEIDSEAALARIAVETINIDALSASAR